MYVQTFLQERLYVHLYTVQLGAPERKITACRRQKCYGPFSPPNRFRLR
jgi:hypothetical protein